MPKQTGQRQGQVLSDCRYRAGRFDSRDGRELQKACYAKKKNLKHLYLLPDKAETIALKLIEGKQVFDTEIYSALKNYNFPKPDETAGEENIKA